MALLEQSTPALPDYRTIRKAALQAGGLDPMNLRFRIVEYTASGELAGVPFDDLGFRDAVERTAALSEKGRGSRFCLEPVGFIQ